MLFPTIRFALFFLVVLPLNWALMPKPRLWKPFILVASFVFYCAFDWRLGFLLAASIVANWYFAETIRSVEGERAKKAVLTAAVAANLAVLGFFKYYGFFVSSVSGVSGALGLGISAPIITVALPIGISFFTFQALSYVIDVFRNRFRTVSLVDFAVYLSFFPHVVAGPIVRASEFVPQLAEPADRRRVDATRAFWLIAGGLFKKVVIASFLATAIVDEVFRAPGQFSSPDILVAIVGYAVQIYADFSGYTDIAIGIALLLGFRFPQNFDRPYTAVNVQEFWHRWHMTLSRWLRDYLYIPLGGNRRGHVRMYVNLFATMLLGGLWHGAAWTFVFWGALHGTALVVHHYRTSRREALGIEAVPITPARMWLARLGTFSFVCLAWVFFRADSFGTAFDLLWRLLTAWGPARAVTPAVLVAIAVGLGAQFVPAGLGSRVLARVSRAAPIVQAVGLALALVVIDAFGPTGVMPFIYFQF
ncbi:MAG: MBOAT family protein [Acidimicrobiia bacterium]